MLIIVRIPQSVMNHTVDELFKKNAQRNTSGIVGPPTYLARSQPVPSPSFAEIIRDIGHALKGSLKV